LSVWVEEARGHPARGPCNVGDVAGRWRPSNVYGVVGIHLANAHLREAGREQPSAVACDPAIVCPQIVKVLDGTGRRILVAICNVAVD
jgi:hypothetical protein